MIGWGHRDLLGGGLLGRSSVRGGGCFGKGPNHLLQFFLREPVCIVVTGITETVLTGSSLGNPVGIPGPTGTGRFNHKVVVEFECLSSLVNRNHTFVQFFTGTDADDLGLALGSHRVSNGQLFLHNA